MPPRSGRPWAILMPVFAAMILAGCTKELTGPRIATLVIVSGSGQQGVIGATLAQPLRVRVEDQNSQPIAGVTVAWRVISGGGTVTPGQSLTDQSGEAAATLQLGTIAGPNTVTASLSEAVSVAFSATATTAPPARLEATAGNAQTGAVGTQLPQNLVVRLTDDLGNPKAGVTVTFTVTSGGGTVSAPSAVTDVAGTASVRWTLGSVVGPQTILATASGVAPLTLTATAQATAADAIAIVSGNNQSGSPGTVLSLPLTVRVTDRFGNPVSGALVVWAAAAGSGSVNPVSSVTNTTGLATTTWTLGGVGGLTRVTATSGTLGVTFAGGVNVNYASISAGGRNTCGVTIDNVMLCWGYNGEGQLGIGQPPQGSGAIFASPQPTGATGNLTFLQAVVDLYHGCAITLSSIGYCWGVNHDGRLGDNTTIPKNAPTQVLTPVSFRMLGVSRNHTCGLSLSDRIWCWGYAGDGQTGTGAPPPAPTDFLVAPTEVAGNPTLRFQTLAAGGQHACAVTTAALGSAAYCWGFNATGQLGDNTTITRLVPTAVSGSLAFSAIAAGYDHTCGLTTAGGVHCWGKNTDGQLGDGSNTDSSIPVVVAGGPYAAITAGEKHSCALTPAGTAFCWGSNANGQLGQAGASSNAPVEVSGGHLFGTISAGDRHTCAVTRVTFPAQPVAWCWGDNQYGQLGNGAQGLAPVTSPLKVAFQP